MSVEADEAPAITVARATRRSRHAWAKGFVAAGVLIAVLGAIVYSAQKQTTLEDASADTTLALQCYGSGVNCDEETSGERHAREARPFLLGGLAGGGVLLLVGLVLFASAPGVPESKSA